MADDNPYSGLVAQDTADQARASVAQVADTNPDDEAFVQGLATRYGLPASTVKAQRKDVERRSTIDSIDYGQLAKANPTTAGWIAQPQNAAIGRDDTGALAGIEGALRGAFTKNYTGASLVSGLHTLAGTLDLLVQKGVDFASGGDDFADNLSVLGGSKDPAARAEAARLAAGKPQGVGENLLYAGDYFGRSSREEFRAAGAAMGGLSPDQQAIANRKYATTNASQSAFLSPSKMAGDFLQNVPTFLALAASARVAGAAGAKAEVEAVAAGADAAAAQAARVHAAAAALSKTGAISEGAVGYAQQAGQTEQQIAEMKPEVLAKSPAYQALLTAGFEPDVARIIIADKTAQEAGTTAGLADAITNLAGGAVLGHVISEGGSFIPRMLKGMATEGVQEAVQSPLEQLGQNAAVKANADPSQSMSEGVAESTLQGLAVGGLSGGIVAGFEGRAHARQGAAQEAAQNAQAFEALDKLAAASKVRERDPASFEAFVKSAAEDGPVQHVYVDGKVLAETLAQSGVNPELLGPDVADQLQAARQTGGDVQIPIEQYATRIAGTDLSTALIPHLKTDPSGMSMAEADEFMQSHADDLKAEVEKVLAAKEGDTAFKTSAEAVKQNVLDQLNTAKRFTPDVNEAYATLMGNFYSVNAARLGVTPEEMFARHPVQIAAEGVVSPEVLGQDTSSPEFKAWFGDSKVVDESGQPLTVYHGTNQPIDSFAEDRRGVSTKGQGSALGFFFTDSPSVASQYADYAAKTQVADAVEHEAKLEKLRQKVDRLEKAARRSGDWDAYEAALSAWEDHELGAINAEDAGQNIVAAHIALSNPKEIATDGGRLPLDFTEQVAQAKAEGHDGVILRNISDPPPEVSNHYVVFKPTQIKSVFNSGAYDPNDPDILKQDLPAPFYSALEKAVLDTQTAKASPEQWAATLQKTPGVKKEELEWTGVLDWLKGQDGAVTKDQVAAFLRNNGVQVEEIVHGGREGIDAQIQAERDERIEQGFNGEHWIEDVDGGWRVYGPGSNGNVYDDEETAQNAADELNQDDETEALNDWERERRRELEREGGRTSYRDYKIEGADDTYRELLLTLPKVDGPSTHWSEHNVVAHVRFTERQDAAGKPVLFLEEVQSDWHQKGRQQGYAVKATQEEIDAAFAARQDALAAIKEAAERLVSAVTVEAAKATERTHAVLEAIENDKERHAMRDSNDIQSLYQLNYVLGGSEYSAEYKADYINRFLSRTAFNMASVSDSLAAYRTAGLRLTEAGLAHDNARGSTGVPNAPFKNSYPQLILKRMIRWALDNKYEQIAWISGDQQNGGSDREEQGDWFYGRNLPNVANDLIKKYGAKVETIRVQLPGFEKTEASPEDRAAIDEATDRRDNAELLRRIDEARAEHSQAIQDKRQADDALRTLATTSGLHASETEAARQIVGAVSDRYREAADRLQALLQGHHQLQDKVTAAIRTAQASEQLGFKITPELAKAAAEGFALFQDGAAPRGSFNPATATITLLRAADLSTFLHESGHFFLDTLGRMAAETSAPQEVVDDMNAVLKWFGVDSLATWRGMTLGQQREAHEMFARGFEAYLFEGKAPSQQLVPLFQRFRAWMLNVYQQLGRLRVTLPDEIKGVFNRMLATNAQIVENERAHSYAPLFESAAQAGMTQHEFEDYQRLGMSATQEAVHALETRSIRDMRWLSGARDRTIKRLQGEAANRRKAVKAEVTAEVMAEPINQARSFLKRGLVNGEQVEGSTKLSLPDLKEAYGEAPTPLEEATGQGKLDTDYRKLGYGKYGMLAEEGLAPDQVAEMFGFSSGDELVKTLLNGEDPQEKIAGLTDQRMLERYGDLHDPQSIEKAADEAIHNDARLRFVGTEMNALAKAVGQRKVLVSAARDFANQMIAKLKVRDIRPSRYSSAEARAAINAEKAVKAGKLVEAATEKRNQLINGYAAKAAYAAQDEISKALRYLQKFNRDGTRKNIDADYRDQIDQLLERFDLRSGQSLRAIDNRKSLANWIKGQQELGFDPIIPDKLANEAFRKSYKDMTVEEMRGLIDSVRNIEHLGRLKKKLLTSKDQRDFAAIVEDAQQTIRDNAVREVRDAVEHNGWLDKAGSGVREFFAMHRKFASLIRQMDGFKDRGLLWETLVRPMNAAGDREAVLREQATKALHAIFSPIIHEKTRAKLFIPEINGSLSLEGRLLVALNWGNETNRARIVDGDKWTPDQVQAILKTLTPEQWAFVQNVWDHVDSYWPMIREKELRVTGVAPEKVEASPFTTPGGIDMTGGYFPIKYDTVRSSRAEADDLAEAIKSSMQGLYTRATTRRGHTKERVETVERPVRKDFGVLFEHITQVTHDLAWHEYLIDANRLIRAAGIDNAIRDHYGPEVLRTMRNALEAMAAGDIPAQNVFERAINHLRTGATIAGLGWNLTTALLQPIGLTQSMVRIGPKWVAKGISHWVGDAAQFQDTVGWINDKSDFMRLRASTRLREISEIKNRVSAGNNGPMTAVEESLFYLIGKFQMIADVPTWLGAYEKAMAKDTDEASAVAFADQAVRDSQGGGQISDLAQIQRGGPLMKLWTNFYSFFNVAYNQLAESVGETRLVGASRLPLLAADVLLLISVPSFLTTMLKSALRGDDWDQLPGALVKDQIGTWLGLMVGVRELGSIVGSDGSYSSMAGLRFFAAMGALYKQAEQGEADAAFLKAANNAAGILFHYPALQVQRTAMGIQALASGQTHNPLVALTGPPPVKR